VYDVSESLREGLSLALKTGGQLSEPIRRAAALLVSCLRAGGKILVCGNGGSAAEAQHFAAELVGRFGVPRPGLAAVSLNADTAVITAISNDFGFEEVFARQVNALGRPGDVLVALSTSGKSPNILRALQAANDGGLNAILITGPSTGEDPPGALCMRAPGTSPARIQEAHLVIIHVLCDLVEREWAHHAVRGGGGPGGCGR
jgi:D-sedoheptulose 7-phosphate isomerase